LLALNILASAEQFQPLLFLDLADTTDTYGLLEAKASTVQPTNIYNPPRLNFSDGSLVLSVLASQSSPGSFEVYCENTTGWEPLRSWKSGVQERHECSLLRFTTRDFKSYSPPHVSLLMPQCSGTPTMKSIARSPAGRYVMFTVGGGDGAPGTYVSEDEGLRWTRANTTGVAKPDKDDLNLIFNAAGPGRPGRFVDMQIVWQNHSLRYCDNGGCNRRRVVSAKRSDNGVDWGADLPLVTPDDQDPPELQFYRMRPFYVGDSGRLAAHTLLYAPAPPQSIVGTQYGRHPSMCIGKSGNECHGPHLYEEWWIGPASGDASDTLSCEYDNEYLQHRLTLIPSIYVSVPSKGRRPYRRTHAAPHDAFLMAPPVVYNDSLLWVGSTGQVFSLPQLRIGGIYAPANGEFSTQAFRIPSTPLWVNVVAQWFGGLPSHHGGGGCDEGCNAYFFCAVLDAESGEELPGYGVNETVVRMDVDALRLPLQWRRGNGTADTSPLAGRRVRLRLYFRDAAVYAVGA
jgi:hypothetical protein